MYDSFRDAFVVEPVDLFTRKLIFEQRRSCIFSILCFEPEFVFTFVSRYSGSWKFDTSPIVCVRYEHAMI
jgi:hypothetical protein